MRKLLLALSLLLILTACSEADRTANAKDLVKHIDQKSLNTLASNLDIKYQFLSNVETDCPDLKGKKVKYCYAAYIHLSTSQDFFVDNWQLNYSQVYPFYSAQSESLNIEHLNGDIHQITPSEKFTGFSTGFPLQIKLWVKATLITESAVLPNYWLSAVGLEPKVVISTKTKINPETQLEVQPYVVPFSDTVKQIKSAPNDINEYASANWLFEHNQSIKVDSSKLSSTIIPTPTQSLLAQPLQYLDISKGLKFQLNNLKHEDIKGAIARLATLGLRQGESGVLVKVAIDKNNTAHQEGYQLSISDQGIDIKAATPTGAFYGIQSLASLYTMDSAKLPYITVKDHPTYGYRGQHIDVARNFISKDMLITLIKQMAAYKLNTLHLHLAEDEAWRLALPSFPELTEIGGKRCMNLSDKTCLQPQLGSAGDNSRNGFYSEKDYIEILTVAKQHHIKVIPSLDMPGHSRAAIKAMEARYYHFMEKEDEQEARRYLLSDLNDKTKYRSIQNYTDNTINVCKESSYRFVDKVLDDLLALHNEANHPLAIYHIGADETAGAWLESPECQALVNNPDNDVHDIKHLGAHFIERISHIIANKGISVAGWNDGLSETYKKNMPDNVYSYIWGALPHGAHKQVSEQAHRNWQVILSTPDVLYFDFPYEVDPKERGYHWASRRLDSRNIFNFIPDNLPLHAEFRKDTLGHSFEINDKVQKNDKGNVIHKPLPKNFRITGIQGQLWTETVRSDTQAQYMIYPRLFALAERAWHKPSWHPEYNYQGAKYNKDTQIFSQKHQDLRDLGWQNFSNAIANKELLKLDKQGVFYRLPTLGGRIIGGKLEINSSLPGLLSEFKTSGDEKWTLYKGPVDVTEPVYIRARSADGTRAGRSLLVK